MTRALLCLLLAACGAPAAQAPPQPKPCRQSLRVLAAGSHETTLVEARCGEIYEAQVGRGVREARGRIAPADWDELWRAVTAMGWRKLAADCPGDGYQPYLIEISDDGTTSSWVCFGREGPPPPFDALAERLHRVGMKALGDKFRKITAPNRRIGIATCDEYLDKSRKCVEKMPEAARPQMLESLDQVEDAWVKAAENPDVRGPLGDGCRQALDAARQAYSSFGCEM